MAHCNFETKTTQVSHDLVEEQDVYPISESVYEVTYGAPMDQIQALMEQSDECYQIVEFNCLNSALESEDETLAMIKNSNDDWIALSDLICSDDQPCVCNSLASTWQRDSGRITEKANLPITAFKYGDLTDENAKANFRIGPLNCQGNKNPFIVENEIKNLNDKVNANARTVQEKSKEIIANSEKINANSGKINASSGKINANSRKIDQNSDKIDDTIGKVDQHSGKINEVNTNKNNIASLKSTIEDKWAKDKNSKVIFMAYKTGSGVTKNTKITFNNVVPNIGGDMNGSSGTFTARIAGTYFFTFSAVTNNGENVHKSDMSVRVMKNGNYVFAIYDGNRSDDDKNKYDDENNINYSWLFEMESGDTLSLKTCNWDSCVLFGQSDQWTTLTGQLLLAKT